MNDGNWRENDKKKQNNILYYKSLFSQVNIILYSVILECDMNTYFFSFLVATKLNNKNKMMVMMMKQEYRNRILNILYSYYSISCRRLTDKNWLHFIYFTCVCLFIIVNIHLTHIHALEFHWQK